MDRSTIDFLISLLYVLQAEEEDKTPYAFIIGFLDMIKKHKDKGLTEDSIISLFRDSLRNPEKIIRDVVSEYGWE